MRHVFGNVAEEEAQGQEGAAGEGLRGPRKTPQRGEFLGRTSASHSLKPLAEGLSH